MGKFELTAEPKNNYSVKEAKNKFQIQSPTSDSVNPL